MSRPYSKTKMTPNPHEHHVSDKEGAEGGGQRRFYAKPQHTLETSSGPACDGAETLLASCIPYL